MKRITESQLRNMIRQCVYESIDECGIEEFDKNSLKKAGKYAAMGALGAAALKGCGELSKLEQDNFDREREGIQMMHDADHDFELDNARTAHPFNESKVRRMVENMVRTSLKKRLLESTLYTDDIDSSDLIVNVEPYTEDGYCEWEATCDNGWYTFRGWYSRGRCELEDVISGHSGHGMQHGVDDELRDWFYDNLEDRVISEIEAQA